LSAQALAWSISAAMRSLRRPVCSAAVDRVVRHDQAQVVPGLFGDHLGLRVLALGLVESPQLLQELVVAPSRHREDELQGTTVGQADLPQRLQVVETQQAAVGDQDQPAHAREALEHRAQGRQQGAGLGDVAVEHLVVDRYALGGLHHPQQELAGDHALLGHAEAAHVAFLHGIAFGADGREVVEHHREILIDQRAQQSGHHAVHRVPVFHQRIHAAQQVLVGDVGGTVRQRHGLQPAQHPELGLRVAEPVEHHHSYQRLDIDLMPGAAKDAAQFAKAQRLPQFMERPDRAQCAGRFELDLRLGLGPEDRCTPRGLQQPVDHRIEGTTDLIESPEGGDGALADAALVIAERLDELDVAPGTGGRDLDVHATKIAGHSDHFKKNFHTRKRATTGVFGKTAGNPHKT
jgi:hypothetical protein